MDSSACREARTAPSQAGDRAASAVAVVIVNWQAAEMTVHAVERVLRQSIAPTMIYVVDNGSRDGSARYLESALSPYPNNVRLLSNAENKGFGGGCNTALSLAIAAGYDFVWLLNNDADPDEQCLAALLDHAQSAPKPIGIVGSLLHDPDNHSAPHFGSWMNPLTLICGNIGSGEDLAAHRFGWLTAASMLISVAALRAVGTFDEEFFMYWEDADLNMRVRDAGFSLSVAADARVAHTAGTSSADIPVRRYLWHYTSQRRWITKHHPHPRVARVWLRTKFLLKAAIDRDGSRLKALLSA